MTSARSRTRSLLRILLKLLIVALVCWGVQHTFREALSELRRQNWTLRPGWLIASGLLYLAGLVPSGWFWHRAIVALGGQPTLGQTLRSYFIGHLGKYVPGKAMVIVLRAGLLRGQKVDVVLASATIFMETLTTMAVGALVAAVVAISFREDWRLVAAALAMAAITGLPVWPGVFRYAAHFLRLDRANPALIERLAQLEWKTLASGWLAIAAGWFLIGLSLWAARAAIGLHSTHFLADWARFTAAVALATVAGFLSFIPAGFGVRDAVLMQVLAMGTSDDAAATALVSAVLLRLVWLVAEGLISGILYGLPRGRPYAEGGTAGPQ